MRRSLLLPLLFLLFLPLLVPAQGITGKWKTVDDETGEEKSVVEIFERDGKYFGKIVRIFPGPADDPDPVCEECPQDDPRHRKKIIGLEIIRNMKSYDSYLADGDILDPQAGRVYRCRLWLEGGALKVRGYWGPFYRTQTWKRAH